MLMNLVSKSREEDRIMEAIQNYISFNKSKNRTFKGSPIIIDKYFGSRRKQKLLGNTP